MDHYGVFHRYLGSNAKKNIHKNITTFKYKDYITLQIIVKSHITNYFKTIIIMTNVQDPIIKQSIEVILPYTNIN